MGEILLKISEFNQIRYLSKNNIFTFVKSFSNDSKKKNHSIHTLWMAFYTVFRKKTQNSPMINVFFTNKYNFFYNKNNRLNLTLTI